MLIFPPDPKLLTGAFAWENPPIPVLGPVLGRLKPPPELDPKLFVGGLAWLNPPIPELWVFVDDDEDPQLCLG